MIRHLACAALISSLLTTAASANEVVITDTRCVSADIKHTHASVTEYAGYSSLGGAKYRYNIPGHGSFPLLSMVMSSPRYSVREDSKTDALVWVMLQPTNIREQEYYPRLLIHCASSFDTPDHFNHICVMDKGIQHFGLQNFYSTLEATSRSKICDEQGTLLVYRLVLDGNADDIEKIKEKAIEPWGPILGPIIALFFDVDKFFRAYYENFYDGWAKSL